MQNIKLTEQVKRKLNITWNDEDTNARVQDIINSPMPYLTHKLGITDENFDFSVEGIENTLFKAWCLYEYNHCANEFEVNYASMIANAQAKHLVANHLKNGGAASEE